jgi:hypothetical protein
MLWPVTLIIASAAFFSVVLSAEPVWQTGTLEQVEQKVESTPRTYVWDVVVTSTDVVTYRLHIRIGSRVYVTDYTPEIQPSSLPAGWQRGRPLQLRLEKGQLLIRTSYGEITTYIRSRS